MVRGRSSVVEQRPFKPRVPGSSPGEPSNKEDLQEQVFFIGVFAGLKSRERNVSRVRIASGNSQGNLPMKTLFSIVKLRGRGTRPSPLSGRAQGSL